MTASAADAIISRRCGVRTMIGVAQLRRVLRFTRQTSPPVRRSSAAMNDPSPIS
jgi:hypothetical protein